MGVGWVWWGGLSARVRAWGARVTWVAARSAVDAVRYQPRHLDLVVACGTSQPEVSPSVAHWLVETRAQPTVVHVSRLPHAAVRAIARQAARWFGPTASALVRFLSGAIAAAADHAGSLAIEGQLRARGHPGLLVPHLHAVAVLAVALGVEAERPPGRRHRSRGRPQLRAGDDRLHRPVRQEAVRRDRRAREPRRLPRLGGGPGDLTRRLRIVPARRRPCAPRQGHPATLAEAAPARGDLEAVPRRRGASRLTHPHLAPAIHASRRSTPARPGRPRIVSSIL